MYTYSIFAAKLPFLFDNASNLPKNAGLDICQNIPSPETPYVNVNL
jgi:hypothetical protein